MADRTVQLGQQSVILRIKLRDTSDDNGAGKIGLVYTSSGLIISTICDNEATATVYTSAATTTQTVATLGTYVAPAATKASFKLVDDTNHPGLYELHLANARFAVPGATNIHITIVGVSDMEQTDYDVELVASLPKRGLWG